MLDDDAKDASLPRVAGDAVVVCYGTVLVERGILAGRIVSRNDSGAVDGKPAGLKPREHKGREGLARIVQVLVVARGVGGLHLGSPAATGVDVDGDNGAAVVLNGALHTSGNRNVLVLAAGEVDRDPTGLKVVLAGLGYLPGEVGLLHAVCRGARVPSAVARIDGNGPSRLLGHRERLGDVRVRRERTI